MEENKLNIYNSNIIKWYPFEKEKNILQIGEKISIIDDQQKIKQISHPVHFSQCQVECSRNSHNNEIQQQKDAQISPNLTDDVFSIT